MKKRLLSRAIICKNVYIVSNGAKHHREEFLGVPIVFPDGVLFVFKDGTLRARENAGTNRRPVCRNNGNGDDCIGRISNHALHNTVKIRLSKVQVQFPCELLLAHLSSSLPPTAAFYVPHCSFPCGTTSENTS